MAEAKMTLRLRDEMSPKVRKATNSLDQFGNKGQRAIGRLDTSVGRLTKGLGSMGIALGGGMIVKDSIKKFAEFDAAMSRIGFKTGATAGEFAKLGDLAKKMGAESQFTISQSAEAMENLATAGLNVNQITKALPQTLTLAASGGLDLGRAAEIAVSTLKQFNLTADQTGRVADVLARQANASMTNVGELGDALVNAGTNAASLGVPLEETIAALGALADKGIRGAEGGTALSQVFARLKAPTGAASKALNRLGVTAYKADGSFKGATKIMGLLNDALADQTMEDKQKILSDIFGQEAAKSANAYLGSVDAINKAVEENRDAAGYAGKAAAAYMDNLGGDLKTLGSRFEALMNTLTSSESSPLRGLVQGLSSMLETLNNIASNDAYMTLIKGGAIVTAAGVIGTKVFRSRAGRKGGSGGASGLAPSSGGPTPVYVTNMPAGGIGGGGATDFIGGGSGKSGNSLRALSQKRGILGKSGRVLRLLNTTRGGRAIAGIAAKSAKVLGRFGGAPLAVGLTALEAGSVLMDKNASTRDKTAGLSGAVGSGLGAWGGAAAGATLGSVVPGVGTVIGGLIGGGIGALGGSALGKWVGGAAADALAALAAKKPAQIAGPIAGPPSPSGQIKIEVSATTDESTRFRLKTVQSSIPGYAVAETGSSIEAMP